VVADGASTTVASAPSPPSDYIPTQSHFVAPYPTDRYTFIPSQSKDYPSKPPPEYIPESPPPYPGKPSLDHDITPN